MAAAIRASTRSVSAGTVALCHICSYILYIMAGIALVVCCMALRGMCNFDVCALEGVLSARRAVADDRTGGLNGNVRRAHHAAIKVIEIAFAAVGCRPIIGIERHGRFGVADQITNVKGIAGICFSPESIFTNGFKNCLTIINSEGGQL